MWVDNVRSSWEVLFTLEPIPSPVVAYPRFGDFFASIEPDDMPFIWCVVESLWSTIRGTVPRRTAIELPYSFRIPVFDVVGGGPRLPAYSISSSTVLLYLLFCCVWLGCGSGYLLCAAGSGGLTGALGGHVGTVGKPIRS